MTINRHLFPFELFAKNTLFFQKGVFRPSKGGESKSNKNICIIYFGLNIISVANLLLCQHSFQKQTKNLCDVFTEFRPSLRCVIFLSESIICCHCLSSAKIGSWSEMAATTFEGTQTFPSIKQSQSYWDTSDQSCHNSIWVESDRFCRLHEKFVTNFPKYGFGQKNQTAHQKLKFSQRVDKFFRLLGKRMLSQSIMNHLNFFLFLKKCKWHFCHLVNWIMQIFWLSPFWWKFST